MKWKIEAYSGQVFTVNTTLDAINALMAMEGKAVAYVKESKYSKEDSFILETSHLSWGVDIIGKSEIYPFNGNVCFPLYGNGCAYVMQGAPAPNLIDEIKKVVKILKG